MCKKVYNPKMRSLCKITIKIIKKSVDKWLRRCYNKDTKREGNTSNNNNTKGVNNYEERY